MTSTLKRPFFRFHLLTLVLVVLEIGSLLFINMHPTQYSAGYGEEAFRSYGWPCEAVFANTFERWLNKRGAIIDVLVAASIVLATALLSEFLIRRRESRKT